MGFGLPSALGAASAFDGRNGRSRKVVVDIDGDGSFLMNVQEMATAFVDNLDVKVFILNNQHLGMVVQWEDRFYKVTACSECPQRLTVCQLMDLLAPVQRCSDSLHLLVLSVVHNPGAPLHCKG